MRSDKIRRKERKIRGIKKKRDGDINKRERERGRDGRGVVRGPRPGKSSSSVNEL